MAELLDKRGGCWSESLPLLTTPATANQNLHKHWNNNFSKYDAGWQDKQVCKTNARLKVYKYNRDYPTSILFFFLNDKEEKQQVPNVRFGERGQPDNEQR